MKAEDTAKLIKTARLEQDQLAWLPWWASCHAEVERTEKRPHCYCWQAFGLHLPVAVWLYFCTLSLTDEPSPSWIIMVSRPCHSLACYLPTTLLMSSDTPRSSMPPSRQTEFNGLLLLFSGIISCPFTSYGTYYPRSTTYKLHFFKRLCAFMLQSTI